MNLLQNCALRCPRGVMVKAIAYGIEVCEFEFHSCYYVHSRTNTLGKCIILLILPGVK